MDIKNYQQPAKKPMTFEEWKGDLAPQWSDEQAKSLSRLHNIDSKKQFEDMLKREYQEYLDNLNGNWLLR
jgi:hypothetical protein